VDPSIPHTDPDLEPPIRTSSMRVTWEHSGTVPLPPQGPDASGLIFLPVLPEDLETILEALGTAAGSAVDRLDEAIHDGTPLADWRPFAALQTKLSAYRPQGGRHE
jgi:hypothetical protein